MNRVLKLPGRSLILGLAFGLFSTPGCSVVPRHVNVKTIGHANKILVYEKGAPILERVVIPGSKDDEAVANWLLAHPDGWKSSTVTYAPGRYVQGNDFSLNFLPELCVLNYGTRGQENWSQVIRKLKPDDPIPAIFDRTP